MKLEQAIRGSATPELDLGPSVFVTTRRIEDLVSHLHAAELACIRGAVPSRRHEFATGRVLAREMLARLGFENAPLVSGTDRTPIWPLGAVGSISHAGGWCAVAVAHASDVRAIGIDVEVDSPLEEETWDIVLTPREQAWLRGFEMRERGELAMRVFSAKEAVYKCQYPVTQALLDFQDVDIDARPGGDFSAEVRASSTHVLQLCGRTSTHGGLVFAAAMLAAVEQRPGAPTATK